MKQDKYSLTCQSNKVQNLLKLQGFHMYTQPKQHHCYSYFRIMNGLFGLFAFIFNQALISHSYNIHNPQSYSQLIINQLASQLFYKQLVLNSLLATLVNMLTWLYMPQPWQTGYIVVNKNFAIVTKHIAKLLKYTKYKLLKCSYHGVIAYCFLGISCNWRMSFLPVQAQDAHNHEFRKVKELMITQNWRGAIIVSNR